MTFTPDSRTEHDSFGPIEVPATALWGAQTQRALHHFPAGDRMPLPLIHAIARVKGAAARVNLDLGLLDARLAKAIASAAGEVVAGNLVLEDIFSAPPIRPNTRAAFLIGSYNHRSWISIRCDPMVFPADDACRLLSSYVGRLKISMAGEAEEETK